MTKPKKRSHHKKAAPKRSHHKKPEATTRSLHQGVRTFDVYQHTATTFWKRLEPAIHDAMSKQVSESGIDPSDIMMYKAITRRVYRGAIMSACTFFIKGTNPSEQLMNVEGTRALSKAIRKSVFEQKQSQDTTGFDNDE